MATDGAVESGRDRIITALEREQDVALELAGQMQARAQAIATALGLLLSIAAISTSANVDVVHSIRRAHAQTLTASALVVMLVSFAASLLVAMPYRVEFSDPKW